MQTVWSVVDLLRRNPHWCSPLISSTYEVKFETRILDKILYVVANSAILLQLLHSVLSPGTVMDSFHCCGNSSLFHSELISLWMLELNVLSLAWISSAVIWSLSADLHVLTFRIAVWTLKVLGSGINGSAVWIAVFLTSLTPFIFSSWQK